MSRVLLFRPRRWQVPRFVREMAQRHPELRDVVTWPDAVAIAQRDGVAVRVVPLPSNRRGRLIRVAGGAGILVNARLSRLERTLVLLHELCHLWRDDMGEPAFYDVTGSEDPSEEFADIFAWAVCSPACSEVRRAARS